MQPNGIFFQFFSILNETIFDFFCLYCKNMIMKKAFLLVLFSMLIASATFSSSGPNSTFTDEELKAIEAFWNFRMELTLLQDDDTAAKALEDYRINRHQNNLSLGEEAKTVIECNILMESFNYLYGFAGEHKESRKDFENARKKLKACMGSRHDSQLSPYTLLCYADITSYYMAYSIADIIMMGMSVKKYQEKCLEQDQFFSPAMINYGQWFYYSPKIFGGSKEKTRQWLTKAIDNSKSPAEEFYARTAYSQFLFEMKEYEECKNQIEKSERLCPGSRYTALLRTINSQGLSINDYNKTKSKILKSAEEYKKKNKIED